MFAEKRATALKSDTTGAVACLEYVASYYASGTKQETGSQLDRMVERERAMAVNDILAYLRVKTGEDLGARLEPWIQKYGKR